MRGLKGIPFRPQSDITCQITFLINSTLLLGSDNELQNQHENGRGREPEQQKRGIFLFSFLPNRDTKW
jgi:hypothetical protein